MDKYLKKFTRAEFEKTCIGGEVATCTPLYRFDFVDVSCYDTELSPFLQNIVHPLNERQLSSYYAIGGSNTAGDVHIKMTMGNAETSDPVFPDSIVSFGTDYDTIDFSFKILGDDPDHVYLTDVNMLRCEEAVPETHGAEADKIFSRIDAIVSLLKSGHSIRVRTH